MDVVTRPRIPGGSLTRSKAVFGKRAQAATGAYVFDENGRSYIDMLCGLGAITLGYREATYMTQLQGVCSLPWAAEEMAAEAVLTHVAPWGSWVRFVKTGSEATHAAYRIAKTVTGRETVVRFAGSYHGWHEWCADPTVTLPIGARPDEGVAAVFVEPHRFEPVSGEWLRGLREWCDSEGALLIFDSMIYGARWHLGGTSGYFGVVPDLECFGKGYGNGQAVAWVVGTDITYNHGQIASGTFSGELSGLSAVLDTLDVFTREPVIETMVARGQQLRAGMDAIVPRELGEMQGVNPACQHLHFHDPEYGQRFSQAMLDRGVIWHPLPVLTMYAHSKADIDQVLEAAQAVFRSW